MTHPSVADVAAVMDSLYPPDTAEGWDQVGLAAGDPGATVTTILYTVDCTAAVVEEAAALGADLVVAHHPLLLRGIHAVRGDEPKGRVLGRLLASDISLFVAHTNADKPRYGVVQALADRLGLAGCRPMVPSGASALDSITTFVPADAEGAVLTALSDAGAGAVGDYDQCSFRVAGTGSFRPLPGAQPYLGTVGERAEVAEIRIEMVLPRRLRGRIVAALHAAHPYQTPAYHLTELAPAEEADAGLGRVGSLPEPVTLHELAESVARALPAARGGIRVGGDLSRRVERVAVQAGAGDDLLDTARRLGADAYLTSDLRHHPASEAREWPDGPALIDVPHAAAEATWLPVVQRVVGERLGSAGTPVTSAVSGVLTDPWNYRA